MNVEIISAYLLKFVADNPLVSGVIAILGILRLIIPALTGVVKTIVGATESKRDDEFVESVLSSKIWNGLLAFLEWISSVETKKLRK